MKFDFHPLPPNPPYRVVRPHVGEGQRGERFQVYAFAGGFEDGADAVDNAHLVSAAVKVEAERLLAIVYEPQSIPRLPKRFVAGYLKVKLQHIPGAQRDFYKRNRVFDVEVVGSHFAFEELRAWVNHEDMIGMRAFPTIIYRVGRKLVKGWR